MSDDEYQGIARAVPDLGNHPILERLVGPTTLSAAERAEAIALLHEAINAILASDSYSADEKLALTTQLSGLADRLMEG
jgi:hypothetical protein